MNNDLCSSDLRKKKKATSLATHLRLQFPAPISTFWPIGAYHRPRLVEANSPMGDPPTDLAAAGLQKIRRSVELLRRAGYRFSDEAIAAMRARKRLPKPSMVFVKPVSVDRRPGVAMNPETIGQPY
nr:hypothetical protein Itr_chr05CG13890 [Ipomoea trifida]